MLFSKQDDYGIVAVCGAFIIEICYIYTKKVVGTCTRDMVFDKVLFGF